MKPTHKEIIELAREHATRYTNRHYPDKPVFTFTQDALQKVIELALERFGAGGGEPVYFEVRSEAHPAWMRVDREQFDEYVGYGWTGRKLYNHPSPTDLRAEYLRGLEEGFKEGWIECSRWAQRDDLIADIGSPSYEACVSAVKALKGKQ